MEMCNKTRLSNCFFEAVLVWLFTPKSKIKIYYNRKYTTFSFYVIIRDKYKMTFYRDRSVPKYSKHLFHLKHKISLIQCTEI